jgi:hypothetical protein
VLATLFLLSSFPLGLFWSVVLVTLLLVGLALTIVWVGLPILALAFAIMIVLPAILLGLAPLLVSGWYGLLSERIASLVLGIGPLLSLVLVLAAAWFGGRPLITTAERSFWSLASLVVQPAYALFREAFRHAAEKLQSPDITPRRRARLRAVSTALAGLLVCALALWAVLALWPATRWVGQLWDLRLPQRLVVPTLANSGVVVGIFLAVAELDW